MNNLAKTLMLILVQIVPLTLGYVLKRKGLAKEDWGRPLSRFIICFFNTSVCLLAAWVLPQKAEMVRLPLASLAFGATATGAALLFCRLHQHDSVNRGAYIVASLISNYGFTLGGFVCLIFLGEKALSMQTVYIFPLIIFIYLAWFPVARHYGTAQQTSGLLDSFLMAFRDITTLPIAGTLIGLTLNFLGVERPSLFLHVNKTLVYTGTIASTFCVGVTLRFGAIGRYKMENLSMACVKFVLWPLLGYGIATAFGMNGASRQVVVILSTVPVGLFASFAASLFGLNRDLANSLFVVNTLLFLAAVLPLLVWLLPVLA